MHTTRIIALALLATCPHALHDTQRSAPGALGPQRPGITDLGLRGRDLDAAGDWITAISGGVAHAIRASTGEVRNLGLAAVHVATDGRFVLIAADEIRQGADLNGNGNARDVVMHVNDLALDSTVNLGVAVAEAGIDRMPFLSVTATAGDRVLVAVDERLQGADLNGDGDRADRIAHLYDANSGVLRNLRLPVESPFFEPTDASLAGDATRIAFGVSEAAAGGTDLNGDGDAVDVVLFTLEGDVPVNSGLAVDPHIDAFDERLFFFVDEAAQAGTDLNGDGDAADIVFHTMDAGGTTNFGLAYPFSFGLGPFAELGMLAERGDGSAVLHVGEADQGGDLNGDGDLDDFVPFVLDLERGRSRSTGLAGFASALGDLGRGRGRAERTALVLSVWEPSQGGADLDGDGEVSHEVAFLYDTRRGIARNLGVATQRNVGELERDASGAGYALLKLDERDNGIDLDGDGDANDVVIGKVENATGRVDSLGVATFRSDGNLLAGIIDADGRYALFGVNEADQGIDLNGDGDTRDNVLHVHDDRGRGRLVDTGIALESPILPVARVGDRAVVIGERSELYLLDLRRLR